MEFPDRLGYSDTLAVMFCDGRADATWLDRAVLRVLTLKFELGLFDDPFPEWEEYSVSLADTGEAERAATRQTLTLTKNEGLLPLRDKNARIAVIGPCAGSLRLLFGGYTYPSMLEMFQVVGDSSEMAGVVQTGAPRPRRKYDLAATDRAVREACPQAKTVFEALCARFPHCSWTQGCDYLDPASQDIPAACAAARSADAVVLCLGGKNGWGRHCNTGEGNDSASLDLPGAQEGARPGRHRRKREHRSGTYRRPPVDERVDLRPFCRCSGGVHARCLGRRGHRYRHRGRILPCRAFARRIASLGRPWPRVPR